MSRKGVGSRLEGQTQKRCYSQGNMQQSESWSRNRWYTSRRSNIVGSLRESFCSFIGERNKLRYRLFILSLNRRNHLFRQTDFRLRNQYLGDDCVTSHFKGLYMRRVIGMISMEWHAHKWHKTLIDRVQSMDVAIAFVRHYFYKRPKVKLWRSGELMEFLDITARIRNRRKTYFFFLISFVALWAMVPLQLLEYDPSIIFNPEMIGILRKAVLHEGCPYKEVSDLVVTDITQCTCGDNPLHRLLSEEFVKNQELESTTCIEVIEKKRVFTLVLAISSAILLTMLHTQVL
ncbi:hypothetical protein CASFOL_009584 [Castilleja foliolosa]|uniref:Uncharacterized protein n=1 Tax=Castilleja foliolosa TaxID=1961234 RepID=A0ABD3DX29_9LAMI